MNGTVRAALVRLALALVVVLVGWTPLDAATVQGTIRYAGRPVHENFPALTEAGVGAYSTTAGTWTFGSVDLAAGSYVVNNLSPGTYGIYLRVSRSPVGTSVLPLAGDLSGYSQVTVAGGGTVTVDLAVRVAVKVTAPFDSASPWPGTCSGCPSGAGTTETFTLAWEAAPFATSYTVKVDRQGCNGLLTTETSSTTGTSAVITQRTVPDEAFIMVEITGYEGEQAITTTPYVGYQGCSWRTHAFHVAASGGERPRHASSARFIPQIAHLAGSPPTFWKADLILTNPTAAPVAVTLRYTPRNTDGLATYREAVVELPAQASRTLTDVLDSLFHSSGAGSLEIQPATVEASCRVYTPGAGSGTYGQGFVPFAADQLAWLGGPAQRLGTGGVAKGAFRSNLALVEVWGEAVTVRVVLLDRNGAQLGEKSVALPPFGNTQLNDVVGSLGGPGTLAEGQVLVEVTTGGGRVGAVLSVVDNASQDPTTVPLLRR